MKNYKIQMMTRENYQAYMGGGLNYYIENVIIAAEDKETALKIAKTNYLNYIINEDYIKTVEEIEEERRAHREKWDKIYKEEEERKALARAKKEEREKAKAKELGLTVEEYKVKIKKDKKIRELKKEIEQLEKELARKKEKLAKL